MKTKNNCESNGQAKLTSKDVNEIKNKYLPYNYTQRQLAIEYGVCQPTIQKIIEGKTWKQVKKM